MGSVKLLDCTLRDGGYINAWDFTQKQIISTIANLTTAGIDYIEIGYLTSIYAAVNGTQFQSAKAASRFIPDNRGHSKYLIMADVALFDADTLCPRNINTLDGIRVVFYKRQIEQAFIFCEKVAEMGYDLFLQPMVTVDYTLAEFEGLVKRFSERYPICSVSVVDSFGCMTPTEMYAYIKVLNEVISKDTKIGFHGHDNMQLSQINAISLFEYDGTRELIIDASVGGIGRGSGNLCTELIAHYANLTHKGDYKLDNILRVVSDVAEPISRTAKWGYSPYLMLTALRRAHPNYATYLLANHNLSVTEFKSFLELIPDDMLTKCTRPYVEELYTSFIGSQKED